MMYTVAKVTHEGPYTNKHGVWASDRTLFAVCELRGEAQMVADAMNETDKRVAEARAEVERLRSERLAWARVVARKMQIEAMAALYDAGSDLHVIVRALDHVEIARCAVEEQEKP